MSLLSGNSSNAGGGSSSSSSSSVGASKPLLRLPTAERERETELEEWAKDIFGAFGGKKPAKKAPLLTDAFGRDCWPSADAATAALTTSIDELETLKRRAVHAIRNLLVGTFCWAFGQGGGTAEDKVVHQSAVALAHAAILGHVETSSIRKLLAAARRNQGLWWALRSGRLCAGAAVTIPADLLEKHAAIWCSNRAPSSSSSSSLSASPAFFGSQREVTLWKTWKQEPESDSRLDFTAQQPVKDGDADAEEHRDPFASLRTYQRTALDAVVAASPSNCCVVLPCGAGKTKLGSSVVADYLMETPRGCVMVLCLRREGIRQWGQELREVWGVPSLEATGQILEEDLRETNVFLATYHRLLSERRREMKGAHLPGALRRRFLSCEKGLLIADECHMVPAPKIQELLRELLGLEPGALAAAPPGEKDMGAAPVVQAVQVKAEAEAEAEAEASSERRLVGLTATLLREGGEGEEDEDKWPLLGRCVHKETFAALAPEYLAPVRCVEVRVPVSGPYEQVFEESPLSASVCLSKGKWEVLEHLLAKHPDEQLLITVERCEQARMIATAFGIVPIDGSVPAGQIKDILDRFRRCKIRALVATHILDDSADFPELSVMIQMGGFFASRRQEQQRLGRLLRWGPEKRKRWEESKERPVFYVLVHDGTVEEQMSKHRTSSVQGIEYERVEASELMTPPMSPLPSGDVLEKCSQEGERVAARATGSDGSTLAQYYERLAKEASAQEAQRLESCRRTAQRWMIEGKAEDSKGETSKEERGRSQKRQHSGRGGGESDGQLSFADIRAWLAGGKAPEVAGASASHTQQGARSPSAESGSSSGSYSSSYYYSDSYSGEEDEAGQGQGSALPKQQGNQERPETPHPMLSAKQICGDGNQARLPTASEKSAEARLLPGGRGRGRGGRGAGGRGRGQGRSVAGRIGKNYEAIAAEATEATPAKRRAASSASEDTGKKARSTITGGGEHAKATEAGVADPASALAPGPVLAPVPGAAGAATTMSKTPSSPASSKQLPRAPAKKFGKLQSNLNTSTPIDICLD